MATSHRTLNTISTDAKDYGKHLFGAQFAVW